MHNAAVATVWVLCVLGSAAAQAAGGADLCTGLVDPYNPMDQRMRFYQAAGFEGELSPAEFKADRGREGAFVCKADTWQLLRVFDRNGNGTISWFEADAYRKAFRERVLAVFDADADGQLAGDERTRANRALAVGRITEEAGRPPRTQPARVPDPEAARRRMLARYDANHDGQLDLAERKAMAAHRAQLQAEALRRRKELLARFDTDRDGRISPEERRAVFQAEAAEKRRKYIENHDTDGDGRLSPAEVKAARTADQKLLARQRFEKEEKRFDADGDGKLSAAEARALAEWRHKMEQDRKARMDRYDGDGDGELSEYERKVMYDDLRRQGADPDAADDNEDAIDDEELLGPEPEDTEGTFRERMLRKYDLDGDGVLSADERKAMWHDQYLKGLGAEPEPATRR